MLPVNARRWILPALLCVAAALYALALYHELPSTPADYRDFKPYYFGSLQLLRGLNPYLTLHLDGSLAISDTPTWLLCFKPLAAMAPHAAYWTWFWINVIALALALAMLIREAGLPRADAISVAALVLTYPPIAANFWFGQSEIFLCLLLTLMLLALRRGRDSLAGILLAASTLLRAYPLGLAAYLLVMRRWRALGWTAGALVVGAAVTVLLVGWDVVSSYISLIGLSHGAGLFGLHSPLKVPGGLVKHPANLNLGAFVKWLYDHKAVRPIPPLVSILALLAELAAVALAFYLTSSLDPSDPDWRGFGVWIVTITLISPLAWHFFLCCFLPMLVGMAAAWRRGVLSRRALYAIAASYLVTTLIPPWGHPFSPLFHSFTMRLSQTHPHIVHLMTENEFASLVLAWLAACWFATDMPSPSIGRKAASASRRS